MKDLIEALTILSHYLDQYGETRPTLCEHDELRVCASNNVTDVERTRLEELSFTWDSDCDNWVSRRFGSC